MNLDRASNLPELLTELTKHGYRVVFSGASGVDAVSVVISRGGSEITRLISRAELGRSNLELFAYEIARWATYIDDRWPVGPAPLDPIAASITAQAQREPT